LNAVAGIAGQVNRFLIIIDFLLGFAKLFETATVEHITSEGVPSNNQETN